MRLRLRHALALATGSVVTVGVLLLGPAGAAEHSVEIKGLSFIPEDLAVAVGDSVTWVNHDTDKHDLEGGPIHSAPMAEGETYSFTFSEPADIEYHCKIHTYMQGRIKVGEGGPPGGSGDAPPPPPSTAPPETTTTTRLPSGPLGLPVPAGVG